MLNLWNATPIPPSYQRILSRTSTVATCESFDPNSEVISNVATRILVHNLTVKTVNLDLVRTAFEKVDGTLFEKFANAAFAELSGPQYVPLGGVKDWGADGVLSTVAVTKKPTVFYQFSVVEDHARKIRETVNRLREV